jgi:hypothetical protein
VDIAPPADKNIRRLHIAVDHPAVMRGLERIGNLRHDFYPCRQRDLVQAALGFAPSREILSLDVLHHDIKRRLVEIDVLDSNDVRVLAHPFLQQTKERDLAF